MKRTLAFALTLASGIALTAAPAQAEMSISFYGGANFSPHSVVDYDFNNGTSGSTTVGWDGASFEMPPYYGVRGTYWFSSMPSVGVAVDFTHAKVKANPMPADFTTLEFTDGINFLTLNAMYRYQNDTGWTPYVGAGLGLSIPHVEVDGPTLATPTLNYQVTGLAAQAMVGLDYKFTDNWSAFVEGKMTYGVVDAELEGGGSLSTNIISNQIILGITYKFF
ncbi:MAG: outer membrane beta-barrel protein [Pseudomonadota bacterium]